MENLVIVHLIKCLFYITVSHIKVLPLSKQSIKSIEASWGSSRNIKLQYHSSYVPFINHLQYTILDTCTHKYRYHVFDTTHGISPLPPLIIILIIIIIITGKKKNHIGKLVYVSHMIGHWKKCVWSICSLSLMELLKAFVLQSAKIRHLKDTLIPIPILRPLFEELIEGSWYLGWRRRQNWPYKVSKVYHPRA